MPWISTGIEITSRLPACSKPRVWTPSLASSHCTLNRLCALGPLKGPHSSPLRSFTQATSFACRCVLQDLAVVAPDFSLLMSETKSYFLRAVVHDHLIYRAQIVTPQSSGSRYPASFFSLVLFHVRYCLLCLVSCFFASLFSFLESLWKQRIILFTIFSMTYSISRIKVLKQLPFE